MLNRIWVGVCYLPAAVAVVVIILTVWIAPTREQRAIANLVKSGACVMLFDAVDGSRFLDADLHGCKDNDEPLTFIPDIENVRGIHLCGRPLGKLGMESLQRIRGLRYLDAENAQISDDTVAQLEADLRQNNPSVTIRSSRDYVELNFGK